MLINFFYEKLLTEHHQWISWYVISFIAGILCYFSCGNEILILCILPIFLCNFKDILFKFAFWLSVAFCFGAIIAMIQTPKLSNDIEALKCELTGLIETIKPTDHGTLIVLDSDTINGKARIRLAKEHFFKFFVGDQIKIKAQIFPLKEKAIGGKYLRISGIKAVGYSLAPPQVITSHESLLQLVRKYIYKQLISRLDPVEGNIAAAMMLGEQGAIRRDVLQNMRYAGISHILCVSGLHLSLVAIISFFSLRFFLNLFNTIAFNFDIKLISAVFSLLISFIYLLLTGSQVAATRAFIMTAIMMIAIGIGRTGSSIRSLGIAAVVILTLHPEYITSKFSIIVYSCSKSYKWI